LGRAERRGFFSTQEGSGSDGARLRWIFSDIAAGSEVSRDQGASWYKAIELYAQKS
jgi:hypothetical protein